MTTYRGHVGVRRWSRAGASTSQTHALLSLASMLLLLLLLK